MTKTVKKTGNITTKKPKVKKKGESDTTLRPKTPLDFSDWSDQDYANHFQLENTLQNAVNILIKFKPDDPTKFLASYFKLTKTKEYPYSLPIEYQLKTILTLINPFTTSSSSFNQFQTNISTTYNILQEADQITVKHLIHILELCCSDEKMKPYVRKCVHEHILTNAALGEPLESQVFRYCCQEALRTITILDSISCTFESLVHRYHRLEKSRTVLSPNYYTIPKVVAKKFIRRFDKLSRLQLNPSRIQHELNRAYEKMESKLRNSKCNDEKKSDPASVTQRSEHAHETKPKTRYSTTRTTETVCAEGEESLPDRSEYSSARDDIEAACEEQGNYLSFSSSSGGVSEESECEDEILRDQLEKGELKAQHPGADSEQIGQEVKSCLIDLSQFLEDFLKIYLVQKFILPVKNS